MVEEQLTVTRQTIQCNYHHCYQSLIIISEDLPGSNEDKGNWYEAQSYTLLSSRLF